MDRTGSGSESPGGEAEQGEVTLGAIAKTLLTDPDTASKVAGPKAASVSLH